MNNQPQQGDALQTPGPLRRDIACPSCLAHNRRLAHFCWRCATPLTSFATVAPLEQVYTLGHAYRQATSHHIPPIVFWGFWLILGPNLMFLLILGGWYHLEQLASVAEPSHGFSRFITYETVTAPTVAAWAGLLLALVVNVAYIILLAKMTWRYCTQRQRQAEE